MIAPVFVLCSALLLSGVIADSSVDKETQTQLGFGLLADIINNALDAAGKYKDNKYASAAKSLLKRIKELQNGEPLEDVAARRGKAIVNNQKENFKTIDDIMKVVGEDTFTNIIKATTKQLSGLMG